MAHCQFRQNGPKSKDLPRSGLSDGLGMGAVGEAEVEVDQRCFTWLAQRSFILLRPFTTTRECYYSALGGVDSYPPVDGAVSSKVVFASAVKANETFANADGPGTLDTRRRE